MWSVHQITLSISLWRVAGFAAAIFLTWLSFVVVNLRRKRGENAINVPDSLDSQNYVQSIKIRCSKRCFIPTEEHEQFNTPRHRTQVTKKLRQTKSHIKSMLLFHGIKVPGRV
jgi:hypothetical protein